MSRSVGWWSLIVLLAVGAWGLATIDAQAQEPVGHTVYLPIVARDYDPLWQWSGPITATLAPTPWHTPLAAIDRQGQMHLLWDTLTIPRFIYHTYLTAQGWMPTAPVAPTLGVSEVLYPPQIDASGTLHLVWRSNLGTSAAEPYRLMYASFTGDDWQPEEELLRSSDRLQGVAYEDVQGNLRVVIARPQSFAGPITYDFVRTLQGWQTYGPFALTHSASWVWPDRQGAIRFYGDYGFGGQTIAYSLWRTGQFVVDKRLISGENLFERNTQLDSQGNLHTFWTGQVPVPGGYVTGAWHQCLGDDLAWGSRTVLSGSSPVSSDISMASDNQRRTLLAYQNAATGLVELKLWQGCTMLAQSTTAVTGQFELQAVALSATPAKLCVLVKQNTWPASYAVRCSVIDY